MVSVVVGVTSTIGAAIAAAEFRATSSSKQPNILHGLVISVFFLSIMGFGNGARLGP
jgi:hypothetical protein